MIIENFEVKDTEYSLDRYRRFMYELPSSSLLIKYP